MCTVYGGAGRGGSGGCRRSTPSDGGATWPGFQSDWVPGDLGVVFGDPQRQRGSSLKVALYRPLPAVALAAPDTAGGR